MSYLEASYKAHQPSKLEFILDVVICKVTLFRENQRNGGRGEERNQILIFAFASDGPIIFSTKDQTSSDLNHMHLSESTRHLRENPEGDWDTGI